MSNFGLLSTNVWDDLWRFWPLILVIMGIDLISGRSAMGQFIAFLITLCLFGFVVLYLLTPGNAHSTYLQTRMMASPTPTATLTPLQNMYPFDRGVY